MIMCDHRAIQLSLPIGDRPLGTSRWVCLYLSGSFGAVGSGAVGVGLMFTGKTASNPEGTLQGEAVTPSSSSLTLHGLFVTLGFLPWPPPRTGTSLAGEFSGLSGPTSASLTQ